jgi:hypothetical protein
MLRGEASGSTCLMRPAVIVSLIILVACAFFSPSPKRPTDVCVRYGLGADIRKVDLYVARAGAVILCCEFEGDVREECNPPGISPGAVTACRAPLNRLEHKVRSSRLQNRKPCTCIITKPFIHLIPKPEQTSDMAARCRLCSASSASICAWRESERWCQTQGHLMPVGDVALRVPYRQSRVASPVDWHEHETHPVGAEGRGRSPTTRA